MQPRKTFYSSEDERGKKTLSPPPYARKEQSLEENVRHIVTALTIIAEGRP